MKSTRNLPEHFLFIHLWPTPRSERYFCQKAIVGNSLLSNIWAWLILFLIVQNTVAKLSQT